MSSISGSMSAAQMMSPNDRMKLALSSAVSTGTVKSTDQSALSSALDDIDTAMKSSGSSAARTAPGQMKQKVDSLIDQEVKDGKLTDDQAGELKQVFADAAKEMKGAHGAGHAHGAGGPPPSTDDSDDDSTTTSSTDSTDSTKSAIEQMMAFLKKLEASMTSTSPYTSSGTSTASTSATASSMLINTLA